MTQGWRRFAALVALATLLFTPGRAAADEEPAARPLTPWQAAGAEYATGVAVAAVTVPLTAELGSMIGRSSSDLPTVLVPTVLLMLLVPPAAVAGAEWCLATGVLHRRAKFHPAVWAGVGVTALGLLLGALGGVWTDNKLSFSLFTVAESLALPAAVTLTMKYRY